MYMVREYYIMVITHAVRFKKTVKNRKFSADFIDILQSGVEIIKKRILVIKFFELLKTFLFT